MPSTNKNNIHRLREMSGSDHYKFRSSRKSAPEQGLEQILNQSFLGEHFYG